MADEVVELENNVSKIVLNAQEFLNDVFGAPGKELGLWLSDNIRYFRFKNEVSILTKAKKLCEKKGISPKNGSFKVLVPLLEYASLEEEEMLQQKWANLLVNSLNDNSNNDMSVCFINVLKELSSKEVQILDKMFSEIPVTDITYSQGFSKEKLIDLFKIDDNYYNIIMDNMYRLNILKAKSSSGASLGGNKFKLDQNEIVQFTSLGYSFVKACKE